MPASMISDEAGGSAKVNGNRIAMVGDRRDAGQHADQRADHRAEQAEQQIVELSAVERPISRLSKRSMCVCLPHHGQIGIGKPSTLTNSSTAAT